MTRLLEHAIALAQGLPEHQKSIDKLKAVVRWAVTAHLGGTMPLLPSTRSSIQQALLGHTPYIERLSTLTEQLGEWIEQAQAERSLSASLPGEVILYTIYARSCDPVADFLKMGGAFSDQDIVDLVIHTTFEGLTGQT